MSRALIGVLRAAACGVVVVTAVVSLIGLFGFAFPALDLVNHFQLVIFSVLIAGLVAFPVLFRKNPGRPVWLAVTLAGMAASAFVMVPEIVLALTPRPPLPTDGRPVLRLMTHNVLGDNDDMARIARVVEQEHPDILALQEFFPYQRKLLDPLLKGEYPYSVHCAGGKRAYIGLYARLPFTDTVEGACTPDAREGERTSRIFARFTLADGTKLTVVTTHLDWPVPLARQARQMKDLAAAIRSTSGPLVLVGDFNSTSWSYALRDFAHEAGLTREDHNILTYPMLFLFDRWRPTLPFLTLDHAMTRGVTVHSIAAAPQTSSDHLPLVLTLSVPPG